jgi:predicted  nucleic acid-binding Zn-ribbon protein
LLALALFGWWAMTPPISGVAQPGEGNAPPREQPPPRVSDRPDDPGDFEGQRPPRRGPGPGRGFAPEDGFGRGPRGGRDFGPGANPDFGPANRPGDGFGPPPGRWDPLNPRRWQDLNDAMLQWRERFETLESERAGSLAELDTARAGFDPARMDAATVVKRRRIDTLLGGLHESIENQRRIREDAADALRAIDAGSARVRRVLEQVATVRPGPQSGDRAADAARLTEDWTRAMDALDRGERANWADILLGPKLGPLALEQLDRQSETGDAEALGQRVRRRLDQRREQIDDLLRRQDELTALVERHTMEIERLRQLIETMNDNGAQTIDRPVQRGN